MPLTLTRCTFVSILFSAQHGLKPNSKEKHESRSEKQNDIHSKPAHGRFKLQFLQQYINLVIRYVKLYPETERVNCAYSAYE